MRMFWLLWQDPVAMHSLPASTMCRSLSRRTLHPSVRMVFLWLAGKWWEKSKTKLLSCHVISYLNPLHRKYKGFRKDSNGFRVYSAWYQHRRENKIKNDPRVVVQHATDAPIRPHHRQVLCFLWQMDSNIKLADFRKELVQSLHASKNQSFYWSIC